MRRSHRRTLMLAAACVLAGTVGWRATQLAGGAGVRDARVQEPRATQPSDSSGVGSGAAPGEFFRAGRTEPRVARASESPSARSDRRRLPEDPSAGAAREPERSRAARVRLEGENSLHLLEVFERPDDPLMAVAGFDRDAPRDLVLWRVDERHRTAAPVARVRSDADGVFSVERLLLSSRGVRLVATEVGGDPFGPGASRTIEFLPRLLEPTPSWLEVADDVGPELVVAPDGRPQLLVLGDDDGRELMRVEVLARSSTTPVGATTRHRLAGAQLPSQIARETPDGQLSSWRPLLLSPQHSRPPASLFSGTAGSSLEEVR